MSTVPRLKKKTTCHKVKTKAKVLRLSDRRLEAIKVCVCIKGLKIKIINLKCGHKDFRKSELRASGKSKKKKRQQ
jgi:hypothetical protein